ncbi:MAG: amino acid permease, partial [Raoultibacter sp.]
GLLPKGLQKLNKHGVPTHIVIAQGIVVSIWAIALTLGGGGDNLSYLAALSLTTVIYLVAYLLLFVSYMRLIRRPDIKRDYHAPGGKIGKWVLAIAGFASSLFALVIAFFPPIIIATSQQLAYEMLLTIGFLVTLLLPFGIYAIYGKKHHRPSAHLPRHFLASEVNRFARLSGRGEHLLASEESENKEAVQHTDT